MTTCTTQFPGTLWEVMITTVCVDTCIARGHSVDNACTTTTVLPTPTLSTAYTVRSHSGYCTYIVAAYVPLTFFIIFILVFRVSVVSPKLYGTISMLQTLASPLNIRVLQEAATHVGSVHLVTQGFLAAMSIWNLDFFRNVMPDNVCLCINFLQL